MVNLTRRIAVLLAMALALGMGSLWAQSDRGTITGTITDSSGARVPGAAVTITEVSTGITNKTSSNGDGIYSVPNLPIGKYTISVEHTGFKTSTQEAVTLNTGQTVGVDITLQVGKATEMVQVTSAPPQLQAETTAVSTVANATLVQDLPLFGQGEMRNPGFFMVMDSSVSSRGNSFGGGGGFNDRSLSTTVAGAPSASAEFHVDGSILASAEQVHADFRLIGFPADAVQEFTVSTIAIPAELGHSGGGITSFTIKSGGNQLHASGYEYLRNNVLDARGFFASTVAPLRQNEFGGNAGGRIIKDKLFFFGWYDGFRISAGASSQLQTVPTAQMLQGNFSNFTAPIGPNGAAEVVPIYDPATTANGARTQFPGNIIPTARFDHVASGIAPYFPAPSGPNASADVNNFLEQGANKTTQNEWGGKIEWQATTKNRVGGSFSYSNENTYSGYNPFPPPLSETGPSINKLPVVRLSDDYLLSPNIVNHITVGFNRWASLSEPTGTVPGGWPAKLGYGGVPFSDGAMLIFNIASGIPQFGGNGGNPSGSFQNNFDLNESLSWVKGKHSAKFGMEFLREGQNSLSTGRASGYLFVNAQETGDPTSGSNFGITNGIGFASFILGQVDSGMTNIYFAPDDGGRGGYWAGYAQDDWKITPKLTANIGMRWDLYEPSVEVHNHAGWMNPGLPNPDAGGILGAAQFAVPGLRSDTPAAKHDFSPRIGFAYALNNKTVIRTSFGILFAPGGYLGASVSNFNQGFNTVQTLVNSSNGVQPDYILQNGWPINQFAPAGVTLTPGFALGSGIQRLDPQDARPPYMLSRVFQIQRQLPGNMLLSVGYIGNHGTRLQSRIDVNDELPPQYLSATVPATAAEVAFKAPATTGACPAAPVGSPVLGTCAAFPKLISDPRIQALPYIAQMPIDPATGNHSPFNGFEKLLGTGATMGQALRTFPQYVSMRRLYEGDGKSDYNSLQVNLNKRFSDGLTMLISYTWSKTLTNAASEFDEFSGFDENSFNQKPQKGLSINDYPQNAVISFSYELPFGPGKKLLPAGGPAGKIVGGWKLAAVLNYQSGPPQLIYEGNSLAPYEGNNDNGDGFALPNLIAGVPVRNPARSSGGKFDPSHQSLLNPAAFALTPNPTAKPGLGYQSYFGDAPVTLGGDGRRLPFYEEDLSLIKKTQITERVNVEFRADFLNLFNRTVFGLGSGGDMYGSILANGVGSTSFGVMSSQSNNPREIQFGLKINY